MPGYFKQIQFLEKTSLMTSTTIPTELQAEKIQNISKIEQFSQGKTRIYKKEQAYSLENQQLIQAITKLFAKMLEKNANQSDSSASTQQKCLSKLRSLLSRFLVDMQESQSYLITAVIYLDKIHRLNENFYLTKGNMVSFMAAALLISVKFLSDTLYENSKLAKLFEIESFILNELQRKFLNLINWQLYVANTTYQIYRKKLQSFGKSKKNERAISKKILNLA